MDLRLEGKRALVTGSSRSIGRTIALTLAKMKVDLVINFLRQRGPAEAVAADIEKRGARAAGAR
ncbi:MAG: SDR family NAD(P)-dependent oxidoreductase [Vicinamibacteria bacterium]|jgi:NAD(P)-dependent dehydrogenase (short-subunit alcohol dehydrogenase family)|nr:SDR family NAD(P)-dependent oxidoreductase [Vicinamibacteria bacterium]